MGRFTTTIESLWPLGVYLALVVLTAAALLGVSFVLGQRHRETGANQPYESGIAVTGTARLRIPAQFYLVAIFFVVFDLETVFIVAWAIIARQAGWAGYFQVLIFIAVLVVALAYLSRIGALEWGPRAGNKASHPPERRA